jgi:hypothetical protein
MGIAASELCRYVIRPTLIYLGRHSATAESLLLGIAASQSALGSALHDRRGHGLYRIAEPRHQALWDHYLALDPERASLVRGLASQHAFLSGPHLELTVNLRYATAIAWLLVEEQTLPSLKPTTCWEWRESGARPSTPRTPARFHLRLADLCFTAESSGLLITLDPKIAHLVANLVGLSYKTALTQAIQPMAPGRKCW